jgi:hypothetical protein
MVSLLQLPSLLRVESAVPSFVFSPLPLTRSTCFHFVVRPKPDTGVRECAPYRLTAVVGEENDSLPMCKLATRSNTIRGTTLVESMGASWLNKMGQYVSTARALVANTS